MSPGGEGGGEHTAQEGGGRGGVGGGADAGKQKEENEKALPSSQDVYRLRRAIGLKGFFVFLFV
jgi:hypothetical protein